MTREMLRAYQKSVQAGLLKDSSNQRNILFKLQKILDALKHRSSKRVIWWPFRMKKKWDSGVGLYIYGPVGSGKTYLMDLFYSHLKTIPKKRYHFHHFMQQVDAYLRKHQGIQDPLHMIAHELTQNTKVLCLDEFLVEEVAVASILAELLQIIFAKGIVLITTANTKPDDLYLDGLHRDRFLPAIALIKQHTESVCLNDHRDYRTGRTPLEYAFIYPETEQRMAEMEKLFLRHSNTQKIESGVLNIQSRPIAYKACSSQSIWFDFDVICNMPRSQLDYLDLVTRFDTVFVSHVKALASDELSQLVLLMRFVDVLYDEGIKLLMSSKVALEAIYPHGPMLVPFQRTLSRLKEMQSSDYWEKPAHFHG